MKHFDKFTKEAQQTLVVAQAEAEKMGLSYIGTEHLLLGIILNENSLGSNILKSLDIHVEDIYNLIRAAGPRQEASDDVMKSGLSDLAKKVIENAVQVA